jgi:ribosomal protein S18 acetylase RimI-like enzyme
VTITIRDDRTLDLDALVTLRARCEFTPFPREALAHQVDGARWVAHAYHGDRLVGFARAISDGVTNAYISSVMVDPEFQRRGIGRQLIDQLVAGKPTVRFVLHARETAVATAFYAALGFVEWPSMYVRDRARKL